MTLYESLIKVDVSADPSTRIRWAWRDRKLPYALRRVTIAEFDAMVEHGA